jgi:hypothetical protein
MCALPYQTGRPGADCQGTHTVRIKTVGTGPDAKLTAEILGLDANGNLLSSLPTKDGDTVQLASRSNARTVQRVDNNTIQAFAPIPLLHVTVEDQGQKAEAFCSNIPWVDVIKPKGGVVTQASGDGTPIFAAVPLTNPSALHIFVDGDDLLTAVPNFTGCSPLSPCNGTANINGQPVSYSNLIVDIAPSIGTLASNTVQLSLGALSCGSHNVIVSSSKLPGSIPDIVSAQCHVDDLTGSGTSSVFAISITDPVPGEITPIVPTPVAGEVCSGTPIVNVNINGKTLSVAGQTHTVNAGGDVYKVQIDTLLDRTDLVRDVLKTHDAPFQTFDAGTNRLAASAQEAGGVRTYQTLIFATGDVAPIGIDPNARIFEASALQEAINTQVQQLVQAKVQNLMNTTSTTLQNAFIVGLSADGVQNFFDKLCSSPLPGTSTTILQIFSNEAKSQLQGHVVLDQDFNIPFFVCPTACSPHVTFTITNVSIGPDLSCPVTFTDGTFKVEVKFPEISLAINGGGSCETDDPIFGVCLNGVSVSGSTSVDLKNLSASLEVSEDALLHPQSTPATVDVGTHGGAFNLNGGVGFCGISDVCAAVYDIAKFFGDLFGIWHLPDLSSLISVSIPIDLGIQIPLTLPQIKVDEQVLANFDQKVSGELTEVHITPDGISAGLTGTFATLAVDTGVEPTPGITLTPAPVPTMASMRAQGAEDALIALSDDTINMFFASLTAAGKLKAGDAQGCFDTGATINTLLPPDCDSLNIGNDIATIAARGYCHAIKGDSCDALTFNDPVLTAIDNANLTATMQGECWGAQGLPTSKTCSDIAGGNLLKWGACNITPNFNLHANQALLFCAKGDVPPRMLLPNEGGAAGTVPVNLRVNDLTVDLVIDRTGNHAVDGPLASLPGCFAGGNNSGDCNVLAACLDINMNFAMQSITCSDGKPGFRAGFIPPIQLVTRDIGKVCSGATSPTSDGSVLSTSSDNTVMIPIGNNAGVFSPDICGAGLNLGGLVSCTTPQILSLEANGSPDLRDYLGITCKVQ